MLKLIPRMRDFIWDKFVRWLTHEKENDQLPLSDFDRMRYELRPGDVLLVEGRSKVSDIIKMITQSIWTHSVLYLGRIQDIDDPDLKLHIQKFYPDHADSLMIIESLLGKGTIVDSLDKYQHEHVRICRPKGLTRSDAQQVMRYAIRQLGTDYNVRQLLDLARFMFPYMILPRRWRSTLFEHNAGRPTKTVCSTMMAEAFAQVRFPIRPVLHQNGNGELRMYRRNSKLITPPDFDYSPYFEIIKYPMLDFDELSVYKKLPWDRGGVHCNTAGDSFITDPSVIDQLEIVESTPEKGDDIGQQTKKSTSPENGTGSDEAGNNEPANYQSWDNEPGDNELAEDDSQESEPGDNKSDLKQESNLNKKV